MVIKKKNTSIKKDKSWFMFATGLKTRLFADYISIKLDRLIEPQTLIPSIFPRMVELCEKSLKLYLALQEKKNNALSHYSSEYGHNIKKLRIQAGNYNPVFNEKEIKKLSAVFDDKSGTLFQHLRYGSQSTIDGFSTNIKTTMTIVEKIFFHSILDHPKEIKKMINHNSEIFMLLTKSQLSQSRKPNLLIQAIEMDNPFFNDYKAYCMELDEEEYRFTSPLNQNENS